MPKILRGIHFFALERPKMKCKQRTVRTTVRTTVRMNTELQRRREEPLSKAWGWEGAKMDQNTCKYGLYVQYYMQNACLNV